MKTGKFWLSLCSLFLAIGAVGQTLIQESPWGHFDRFALTDGLSDLTVNAILQTRDGFLWIGTRDGLNRYDGNAFQVFQNIPRDSTSIGGNNISDLTEDRDGGLWIATSSGLSRLDSSRSFFTQFHHDQNDPTSLSDDFTWSIHADRFGGLWVGTDHSGMDFLPPGSRSFLHFRHGDRDSASISSNAIEDVFEDSRGNIWAATSHAGLNLFDRTTGGWRHFRHDPRNRNSPASDDIWNACARPDGTILLGFEHGGIDQYDPATGQFEHLRLAAADAMPTPFSFNAGGVWYGTQGNGIGCIDLQTHAIRHWKSDPNNPRSISDNFSTTMCRDRSGCLWIGTGNGLNKIIAPDPRFETANLNPGPGGIDGATEVSALMLDRHESMWIGTDKGLACLQPPGRRRSFQILGDRRINALLEDSRRRIWIGTDKGLWFLDGQHGGVQKTPRVPEGDVMALVEDSLHFVWVGTSLGLFRLSPDLREAQHWVHREGDTTSISNDHINVLTIGADRRLWIGGKGGLDAFDRANGRCTRILANSTDDALLFPVLSLLADGPEVWVGTAHGLGRYDIRDRSLVHFTKAEGLHDTFILGLLKDRYGNLWISTRSGIIRFAPSGTTREHQFTNLLPGGDHPVVSFSPGAAFSDSSGILHFGGKGGMLSVRPDAFRSGDDPPPMSITAFLLSDRQVSLPRGNDAVVAGPNQNSLSMDFAVLDFVDPRRNSYELMMEGLENSWVRMGNSHTMRYTSLPAGEYLFRVRGADSYGRWNEQGASVRIVILPPFWRRWWFMGLGFSILVASVALTFRARVRRLVAIERIRSRIATDLHDDIGAGLTRITLFSEAVERELHASRSGARKNRKLNRMLEEISATSRDIVEAMSDIVWAVEPRNDSFDRVLLRMKTQTRRLLEARGMDYSFRISDDVASLKMPMDFRRNFFLVFKEAVNNILRHAHARQILLSIETEGGGLVMTIEDDGRGFDHEATTEGNGLRNMRKRAALLNGVLLVGPAANGGTVVTLRCRLP